MLFVVLFWYRYILLFLDKKCRRPENPAYGSVLSQNLNQNLFNPGEKVWFKCDYGYDLDGKKYVVCQKNGNWQPQPFPRCVRRGKNDDVK